MKIPRAWASATRWLGTWALAAAGLWLPRLLLNAATASTTKTVCGKPVVTGKIYGGTDAPEQRWPWQISLLYQKRHICGGALIDHFWVVSAAHCFQKSRNPSDYKVLLGYNQLQKPTGQSLQMTVYRIFVHSDFNKTYFLGSDITLLQLSLSVNFTSHILPVCLMDPSNVLAPGLGCWITGWGMVTEEDFLPKPYKLQQAHVGIIDSHVCKSFFQMPASGRINVPGNMLCAADLLTGKAICQGDSGGPLVCQLNDTWYLAGLSSWSAECRWPIFPSVFTRLTEFTDWIRETQKGSPDPAPELAPPQEKPPVLKDFIISRGPVHMPGSYTSLVCLQAFLLLLASLCTP
ncbi:serine protease 40 [Talpa occidentalis]|uniref:serine protease 40 n=1 Tax=Talpa occidentalis TaxID=50954 RepID=UPI00188FA0DB|nr:serine protease 40 [Talpa occidentalis]